MINYGRGLCNLISQVGRAFYFLVSHSLHSLEQASTVQLQIGQRVVPSSQNATGPSPLQTRLDLPEEGPPGLWVLSFSWTQFPCPASA